MIATWMLYCLLSALGLSVAAALAERALLAGHGPVRLIWIGAVALSLLVPALAFRFAQRPGAAATNASINQDVVVDQVLDATLSVSPPIAGPPSSRRNWSATLARFDEPLGIAWITLSLALAFNFFGGIITLAWMRRSWQRRTVLGVSVFVSERTGPAVVGAVSPAIVLPEWVLALEPAQLALLLRHEQEHQRAGDGRLLTAAELALIAMPWNLALWWQILRLRVAVELDCDARVLQEADERSYGDLLLEVARPRSGPRLMGATAFAERATQLERRIRVLARHRVRTSRAARVMAICIGLTALTVAWAAPRPPAPARRVSTDVPAFSAPPPVQRTANIPTMLPASNAATPSAAKAPPITAEQPRSSGSTRSASPLATQASPNRDSAVNVPTRPRATPADCVLAGGQAAPPRVDSIYDWLFDGIALPPDQEVKACELLTRLHLGQLAQDVAFLVYQTKRIALETQRNAELRTLLTNDADRAMFDEHVSQPEVGRGRRSGGPPPDLAGARRSGGGGDTLGLRMGGARSGGGGGARGGGRGTPQGVAQLPDPLNVRLIEIVVPTEFTLRRLFEGIALSAEQEASARALITKTQEEVQAERPRPDVRLRLNLNSGLVAMPAASAGDLLALVSNEADRAKLQARILFMNPNRPQQP